MTDGEFQSCPRCKEQIQVSAIECPYCGKLLMVQPESHVAQPMEERIEAKPSEMAISLSTPSLPPEGMFSDHAKPATHSSAPPGDENEQPFTATTDKPATPGRSNYFLRHWRGDLSLGVSYWANGFIANLLLVVVVGMGSALQERFSLNTVASFCIFIYGFSLALSFWQIVGTWRSASNHVQRGGQKNWATLAKLSLFLATFRVANLAVASIVPQTIEFWNILCGDKRIPAYSIQVLPGGTELEFTGGIRAGLAQELERALHTYIYVKVLRVNSAGGRVHEAMKIARLVRERGLDTYTSEYCLSAATLVFIAGHQRVVAEGAKLGFHGGTFPGMTVEQLREGDKSVRQAMATAGVAQDFIKRALATPNDDMWYPSVEELRAAGVITKQDAPLITFASNMVSFLDSPTNSDAFKPEATGHEDVDRLTKAIVEFSQRWADFFTTVNAELEQAGEPNVFSNTTLEDQEKIREALRIQFKRKQIIEQCRSKAHEKIRLFTNELASMAFSGASAKGMLKGANRSTETVRARVDRLLNFRAEEETAKVRFLSFMFATFSDFRFTNSNITFRNQSDLERYSVLGKAITDSSKALEVFHTEMLQSIDASKDKLKGMAQ